MVLLKIGKKKKAATKYNAWVMFSLAQEKII